MITMKNDLHDAFDEVIFDKLGEWKNNVDKEFDINLVDAFWLMHLDFEHFKRHLRPTPTDKKRNAITFHEDIENIKHKILEHYSRRFEDDFQNYPTNMFDKIDYEFRNLYLEKSVSIGNKLLSKTLDLAKNVKSLFKEIREFQNRYGQELQIQKPISSLSDIEKLQTSLTKDELSPETRKNLSLISTKATDLKDQIRELTLNPDETEFNAAIKFCDEHASKLGELGKPLKDCLTAIYYLLDHSFNVELILLFLFGKFDRAGAGEALKLVIERHEKFFLSLYNELKSFYPQIDVLLEIAINDYPRAIEAEYYQWLHKFSPPDEPRAILFKLKKLINLYKFYCKAQKVSRSKCIEHVLFTYEKILIETRFTEFHYAPMWSNLPNYMMHFFGLNQSDLAKILGVGNHNITREMSKGTLVTNHKVLFQAATDFSYTYILGETTIPYYGKNYSHETKYMFGVAIQMAYAEMFLNYIDALVEYREEIANTSHISKSKLSSKNEYTLKMSEQIQIMVRRIQEMRESVFDCRTIPTYDKIQTAKKKSSQMRNRNAIKPMISTRQMKKLETCNANMSL